jgi:hypothetical protein
MKKKLGRIWERWKKVSIYIGDFQSRLFLTLFYFTVLVPFGLFTRLLGDLLHLRRPPASDSAWIARDPKDDDLHTVQRQF